MSEHDSGETARGLDRPTWPYGNRAALCLCIDVSEPATDDALTPIVPEPWYERAGADRLLRLLEDTGVNATFTWYRPGAISFDLIDRVQAAGHEVAARLRDDLTTVESWADALLTTRDTLAARINGAITGCKASGQVARPELYQIAHEAGLNWIIDQPYGDQPLPLRPEVDAAPLIHLPTSRWFDDRRLIDYPVPASQLFEAWRDELDTLREEGGLLCLSWHPSISGRPGPSRAVTQFLDFAVDAGDIWIAPAGAIATWWTERSGAA